jgi:hypothetical protein
MPEFDWKPRLNGNSDAARFMIEKPACANIGVRQIHRGCGKPAAVNLQDI